MTRVTPDHETVAPRPHVQRDPAAEKARDRRRLQRAILGRYGSHPPSDVARSLRVRPDGIKQVTRRLAVKRVRAAGRMIGRWWKRYSRGYKAWMMDRIDQDENEGSNGK